MLPYVEAVVAAIRSWLPDLASCDTHPGRFDLGELKNFATKTPGVRVAILGLSPVEPLPSGERDVPLLMAAYVITKDAPGLPRHVSALNITETLANRIPDHHFGACSGPATGMRGQNLYSGEINKAGVNLWALSWSQTVRIGTRFLDLDGEAGGDCPPIPSELYVSCEPETGLAHIDEYELVEGFSE